MRCEGPAMVIRNREIAISRGMSLGCEPTGLDVRGN